jgi:ABC-type nitrate/sulfonate/bicarbonate transport system substrate-binding protein
MGGLFLNGNVATREDVIANRPELVGKVVRTIARTLVWISNHSNAEMVDALALSDVQERNNLLVVLAKYKSVYPPDGRISDSQVATVTRFLHATESTPAAQKFDVKTLMNTRWAGTAP